MDRRAFINHADRQNRALDRRLSFLSSSSQQGAETAAGDDAVVQQVIHGRQEE
jgi:hypothetical protein